LCVAGRGTTMVAAGGDPEERLAMPDALVVPPRGGVDEEEVLLPDSPATRRAKEDVHLPFFEDSKRIQRACPKPISTVKFAPPGAGDWLAAGCGSGAVYVFNWRAKEGHPKPAFVLEGHTRGVNEVCWSARGDRICSASDDFTARVWNVSPEAREAKEEPVVLRGHENFVFCCAMSHNGVLVATGGFDETVRLWDSRKGTMTRVLPAACDPVASVCFDSADRILINCAWDGTMRIWSVHLGELLHTYNTTAAKIGGKPPALTCARLSPNNKFLFLSTLEDRIDLVSLENMNGGVPLGPTTRMSTRFARSYGRPACRREVDGEVPEMSMDDLQAEALEASKGKGAVGADGTYQGHSSKRLAAYSALTTNAYQKRLLATGSEDGRVYLYHIHSGEVQQVIETEEPEEQHFIWARKALEELGGRKRRRIALVYEKDKGKGKEKEKDAAAEAGKEAAAAPAKGERAIHDLNADQMEIEAVLQHTSATLELMRPILAVDAHAKLPYLAIASLTEPAYIRILRDVNDDESEP